MSNPLETQVGGSHYREIYEVEYHYGAFGFHDNNENFNPFVEVF